MRGGGDRLQKIGFKNKIKKIAPAESAAPAKIAKLEKPHGLTNGKTWNWTQIDDISKSRGGSYDIRAWLSKNEETEEDWKERGRKYDRQEGRRKKRKRSRDEEDEAEDTPEEKLRKISKNLKLDREVICECNPAKSRSPSSGRN